ncbi:hypothetical protein [Streptomyces boncukensis]|uniref:Secreted protein n=1 Tax=Streptomyces boncukensis TaxID=2711219 RepID=A0A6G4WZ88_9ACTN|nr:hypothetical protein [Streptomyces boncukensis]NGO70182.1 hypothetical protein [Streptomyces boncukensis]
MTNTKRRVPAVALVSAALLAGGAATSHAQSASGWTGQAGTAVSDGQGSDQTLAARWAACAAKVNNPHWSKGAKSVIFKTRVTCAGNIAKVHVKVIGKLYRKSGGRWKVVTASNQTEVKSTNGTVSTYYTPKKGGKRATLDGVYRGKITVRITSPFPGTKGKASSKAVKVNTPGK